MSNCFKILKSNTENDIYPIPSSIKWKKNSNKMYPEDGAISLPPKRKNTFGVTEFRFQKYI